MDWVRILAYITGAVDQELLLRNEYLAAENRILKAQINGRLRLSDAERATLGEIGHRLGRKGLEEVAPCCAARYDSGMVSAARGAQVRWVKIAAISWPAQSGRGNRATHCPHGQRQFRLGV
jgi:hypothetical protein